MMAIIIIAIIITASFPLDFSPQGVLFLKEVALNLYVQSYYQAWVTDDHTMFGRVRTNNKKVFTSAVVLVDSFSLKKSYVLIFFSLFASNISLASLANNTHFDTAKGATFLPYPYFPAMKDAIFGDIFVHVLYIVSARTTKTNPTVLPSGIKPVLNRVIGDQCQNVLYLKNLH